MSTPGIAPTDSSVKIHHFTNLPVAVYRLKGKIRNMKKPAIFLALFVALFACKKERLPDVPVPASLRIRFDLPAVGQASKFIGLSGEEYFSSNNDLFEYSDDTLRLEIVAKDANGFKVKESLHYNGAVHEFLDWEKDSVYLYYLKISNDTLRVIPAGAPFLQSRIFGYQMTHHGIPLKKILSPQVEIDGWKTSFNYCECYRTGYTENYTLFGKLYERLNVVVENSPMALDGSGETYVYDKSSGIVRASTYGWWTQSGYGWDLLPE